MNLEIVALDTSTPQLLAPQAGDGYKATLVWNNGATTFTGMLFDLTNTASAAGSKLLDMQVGGNSIFSVDPDTSSPGLTVSNASAATLFSVTNSTISGTRTLALTPAANTSALTASSYSVTGTGTTPMVDLSGAWSTTGTATLIKANLTADTGPSNAASLLMDLQVGGTSLANITKGGVLRATGIAPVTGSTMTLGTNMAFTGASVLGFDFNIYTGATTLANSRALMGNGFNVGSAYAYSFSSTTGANGIADLILTRDAAGTLAQRNANNGQTFRLYGRYTDATNDFERFFITASGTAGAAVQLGTQKGAVAGTARALELQTDGTTRLTIGTTGSVTTSAALITGADLYVNGLSNTGLRSNASGILLIANTSFTDFNRLQFGGTTSSFPALKRSSATLISRLADDSANAAFEAASLKTDAPAGGTAATWKLGAVASVSPTSPNRTIEVDIGGTIYYLHAKTTND